MLIEFYVPFSALCEIRAILFIGKSQNQNDLSLRKGGFCIRASNLNNSPGLQPAKGMNFASQRDAEQIARALAIERERRKRAQKAAAFLFLRPRIYSREEQVERIVCLYLIPAVAPCCSARVGGGNGGGCGANFSRDPIVMHIQTALKK